MRVLPDRRLAIAAIGAAAALACAGARLAARGSRQDRTDAVIGSQGEGVYLVPTGQTLTPAGKNVTFDSRPVDMALSPDGRTLAVMTPNSIRLLDTERGEFRGEPVKGAHTFGGIVWSPDGRVLYSTGRVKRLGAVGAKRPEAANPTEEGAVFISRYEDGQLLPAGAPILFPLRSRIAPNIAAKNANPCGLALSPNGRTLYATLFNNGNVAAVDLASYDTASGKARIVEAPAGSSPERIVVSPQGDRLYVADRGGRDPEPGDTLDFADPVVVDPDTYKVATGTVSVLSADRIVTDPKHAILATIPVGLQPADLSLCRDGRRLFTANANGDSVSVIDTASDSVVETIPTSPAPGGLGASSPNGLAPSPDGRNLYVTLGGDNAVEVLALDAAAGGRAAKTSIAGLIPTAWFPLAVVSDAEGKRLFVANSKGVGSLGAIVRGLIAPGAATPQAGPGGALQPTNRSGHSVYAVLGSVEVIPVPGARALRSETVRVGRNNRFDRMADTLRNPPDRFWERFKHAVFVIKENRTYDQVFGDVAVPAGHVGGDPRLVMFGERVTPNHHALAREFGLFDNLYCTGEISADGHHWLNEAFADDYDERAMHNYPRSYPCCGTDPLSFAGNMFLWQAALRAGRTFRNYGEFGPLPSIRRHSDNEYNAAFTVSAGRNRDVAHAERILQDLQSKTALADLTFVWFSDDHTSGTRPGAFTPETCVADNDLALGRLIEAITQNPRYWREEPTAVFIVEDDAQGGLDHVEGHRTVGLVVSPYNRRGQVCSINYNQLSMVRTIECILGLKPLNQFDAATPPMREVFQEIIDSRTYSARPNQVALNQKNLPAERLSGSARHWALESSRLDFSAPDRADPEILTEVLWHHSHGGESYPPADAAR
jgi:YVTN family beta-propeller protein